MTIRSRNLFVAINIFLVHCIINVRCEGDHMVKIEDVIVDYVNEEYFDVNTFNIAINYYEDLENTMNIRIDVIRELPPVIFMKMKVLGRAFGQYKVPTGINMDVNVCDGALKKYFLEYILKSMGADFACPPPPGIYKVDDLKPDVKGQPLYALPGLHVLVDVEVYSPGIATLMKIRSYSQIN